MEFSPQKAQQICCFQPFVKPSFPDKKFSVKQHLLHFLYVRQMQVQYIKAHNWDSVKQSDSEMCDHNYVNSNSVEPPSTCTLWGNSSTNNNFNKTLFELPYKLCICSFFHKHTCLTLDLQCRLSFVFKLP